MADNYLEKRYEEVFGNGPKPQHKRPSGASLDSLLLKNRSVRGYDPSRKVTLDELRQIIAVNTKTASSKNWQILRFKPVVEGPEADIVNANIKMGALFRKRLAAGAPAEDNPDLPLKGTEPQAFIVVFSQAPENSSVLIDLGISLQSMSLKAVEMGLNCLMIRAMNKPALKEAFHTDLEPVAVLAVGKSAEKIFILPVHEGDNIEYYRKDGIHYVPKLQLDDIII